MAQRQTGQGWTVPLGELIAVLYDGYQCALADDRLGELAGLATCSTVQLLLASSGRDRGELPVGHLAPRALPGA